MRSQLCWSTSSASSPSETNGKKNQAVNKKTCTHKHTHMLTAARRLQRRRQLNNNVFWRVSAFNSLFRLDFTPSTPSFRPEGSTSSQQLAHIQHTFTRPLQWRPVDHSLGRRPSDNRNPPWPESFLIVIFFLAFSFILDSLYKWPQPAWKPQNLFQNTSNVHVVC